jgi:non-specific serine/threonine protein kinase
MSLLIRALELTDEDRAAFESTIVRRRKPRRDTRFTPIPLSTRRRTDAPRTNVPRALTGLIGREQEMAVIAQAMRTTPLVTLVGAGGIGKTRLAQELARLHADEYADGAWLVELADLTEPATALGAVAAAVGLGDARTPVSLEVLTEHLRPKQLLLILDNCDHLVSACADLVRHLLRACPDLHVLATSREPLAIGELLWIVRPLEVPDSSLQQTAEEIATTAAVRLFVDRARAISPHFAVTEDNAAAVARICLAVDGIPLGLELAAARTRLVAIEQLADRLEQDADILSSTNRNSSPRHRTLRATIDWSYDLLGPREQILLRRLAVFCGCWTLDMAEEACTGGVIGRGDVLDLLAQLVDKSMILVQVDDTVARYRLLEPIRQYALERLEASGESAHFARIATSDCFEISRTRVMAASA